MLDFSFRLTLKRGRGLNNLRSFYIWDFSGFDNYDGDDEDDDDYDGGDDDDDDYVGLE